MFHAQDLLIGVYGTISECNLYWMCRKQIFFFNNLKFNTSWIYCWHLYQSESLSLFDFLALVYNRSRFLVYISVGVYKRSSSSSTFIHDVTTWCGVPNSASKHCTFKMSLQKNKNKKNILTYLLH